MIINHLSRLRALLWALCISVNLELCLSRAEAGCADGQPIKATIHATNIFYRRELTGYFSYTKTGTSYPLKYKKRVWSGSAVITDSSPSASEQTGIWFSSTNPGTMNLTLGLAANPGLALYNSSGFLGAANLAVYSTDPLPSALESYSTYNPSLGVLLSVFLWDHVRVWNEGALPSNISVTPTVWSYTQANVPTAVKAPAGFTRKITWDVREELSELFTPEEGIARADATKYVYSNSSPVSYKMDYEQNWAPYTEDQIRPVRFWYQTANYWAEFNNDEADAGNQLCTGEYRLTYAFKHWAVGASEPSEPTDFVEKDVTINELPFRVPFEDTFAPNGNLPNERRSGVANEQPASTSSGPQDRIIQPNECWMLVSITARKLSGGVEGSTSSCEISSGTPQNNSVDYTISLGKDSQGRNAGLLSLKKEKVDASIYQPSAWSVFVGNATEVVVKRGASQEIMQVKSSGCLADIISVGPGKTVISLYDAAQVGAYNSSSGRFAIAGDPYVAYIVENPDLDSSNRVRITETRGTYSKPALYEMLPVQLVTKQPGEMGLFEGYGVIYATTYEIWTMRLTLGLGTEQTIESVDKMARQGDYATFVRRRITDSNGKVASDSSATYENASAFDPASAYGYGGTIAQAAFRNSYPGSDFPSVKGDKKIIATTTYRADGTSETTTYGESSRTYPFGGWENSKRDSIGRKTVVYRPYLDVPSYANLPDTRATEYTYDTATDLDADGIGDDLTCEVQKTRGTETRRSYKINFSKPIAVNGALSKAQQTIITKVAGAAWNAAGNLVSAEYRIAAGLFAGQLSASISPDGTGSLITYALDAGGNRLITVKTGHVTAGLIDVDSGNRSVKTIELPLGDATSESTYDIASGLTISSWSVSSRDSSGRPTRIEYNDGTFVTRTYTCCGLETESDRHGIQTVYTYDSLGRVRTVSRLGVSQVNSYDAAGRVVRSAHKGLDGSEIVEMTAEYDTDGSLIWKADAVGRKTIYSHPVIGSAGPRTYTSSTSTPSGTIVETYAADGNLLERSGTATPPMRYSYGLDSGGTYRTEYKLGQNGETSEWVRNYVNFIGVNYKTVNADGSSSISTYNTANQLIRFEDEDGVITLFTYNSKGEREVAALDLNHNGTLDYDADQIRRSTTQIASAHNTTVSQSAVYIYPYDGDANPQLLSLSEISVDGKHRWFTQNGLTTVTDISYPAPGIRTETVTTPDSVRQIRQYSGDQLSTLTVMQVSLGTLSSTAYEYDSLGRVTGVTDSRRGKTLYAYYDDGQIKSVTTPDPDPGRVGGGYNSQTIVYSYDGAGRMSGTIMGDGTSSRQVFNSMGLVSSVSGGTSYPVDYTYDSQGRMTALTTFKDATAKTGASTTRWEYDPKTGRLAQKVYPDGSRVAFEFSSAGRMSKRTSSRSIVATLAYTSAGRVSGTTYSDSTGAISITHDRLGRVKTVSNDFDSITYTYEGLTSLVSSESHSGGVLGGISLTRAYDGYLRLSSITPAGLVPATYGYDSASRIQTITYGTSSLTMSYVPSALSLVQGHTVSQDTTTRAVMAKVYDNAERITSQQYFPSNGAAFSSTYVYDARDQRTRLTQQDGGGWDFGYDGLGQLASGKKRLWSQEIVQGSDFQYVYDDIGNRKATTTNDAKSTYTVNTMNQYTQRSVPAVVDVVGSAAFDAEVTVNSLRSERQGEWYYKQLNLDNSEQPVALSVKVNASKVASVSTEPGLLSMISRTAFVPQNPETFLYDSDGNLTQDGQWVYAWDGENRLTSIETRTDLGDATLNLIGRKRLEMKYDAGGRRIEKRVSVWSGTAGVWALKSDTLFLYDGWNLVAELDALSAKTPLAEYVWGLDLSGSVTGAGGCGGLLFTDAQGQVNYSCYDGNGNVIGLLDLTTGSRTAVIEYDPFGNIVAESGPMASSATFRFSTKYSDHETNLAYFGFRYYNPSAGRWLSRDPLEESDSPNVYGFIANRGPNTYDVLGLYEPDGHFYSVFLVARLNGMSSNQAYRIAYYAQYPDQDQRYDARPAGIALMMPPTGLPASSSPYYADVMQRYQGNVQFSKDVQMLLHSLHGGDSSEIAKRRKCLADLMGDGSLQDWERGFVAHALGDAFAHTEGEGAGASAYSSPEGHAWYYTIPDHPSYRPALFASYLTTLNDSLGGGMSGVQIKALSSLMTRTFHSYSDRLGAARELARRLGYSQDFDPFAEKSLDPAMPKYDRADVEAFFDKIKSKCACGIRP